MDQSRTLPFLWVLGVLLCAHVRSLHLLRTSPAPIVCSVTCWLQRTGTACECITVCTTATPLAPCLILTRMESEITPHLRPRTEVAVSGMALRRIDITVTTLRAHRFSYHVQACSPRRWRGLCPWECFAGGNSHLSVGVLGASPLPAPLSLSCGRQDLCLGGAGLCPVLWDF